MNLTRGLVLILPGVMNVTFYLAWCTRMIRRRFSFYEVEARSWGPRLRWIANLRAYDRNRRTAEAIARELAAYRQERPDAIINVIGYSGGGGLAVMVVAALPKPATINRLLLLAPAISPDYPLQQQILPNVTECVVNYASRYDLQIGQGTKIFGNMDGVRGPGAGAVGFGESHPRLVQVHWHTGMLRYLHFGDHLSYLSPPWQRRYLLPALDPGLKAESLAQVLA